VKVGLVAKLSVNKMIGLYGVQMLFFSNKKSPTLGCRAFLRNKTDFTVVKLVIRLLQILQISC
jgi:hypothetical protein